jgi:sarcosine oxidase
MPEFDAIVVGLGAMGSATLYQLAKAGKRVLGIDRFSPPHNRGSSHGETRITRLANGEASHYTPLVRRSHAIWREIEHETGAELLTITGGLIMSCNLVTETTHVPEFFRRTLEAAKTHGVPHEILDEAQIRKRFPQFHVDEHESGYFEPSAGFVRPEACVRAQLQLAEKYGAAIHTGARVIRCSSVKGEEIIETDKGSYRARQAVLSAGAWMPNFIGNGYERNFRVFRQTQHWFDVSCAAAEFAPGKFPIFIWELHRAGKVIYGFPAVAGADGGIKIATERYEETTSADSPDSGPDEPAEMHRDLIAPFIPEVGSRCLRSETCLYTVSDDAEFVIDKHPDMENVVVISACSGHGFKHSAAIGEAVAQWISTGNSPIDLSPFRLCRFGQ